MEGHCIARLLKRSEENDGEFTSLIKYPSILLDSTITGASIGARIGAIVGCLRGPTRITTGTFVGAVVGAAADVANPPFLLRRWENLSTGSKRNKHFLF